MQAAFFGYLIFIVVPLCSCLISPLSYPPQCTGPISTSEYDALESLYFAAGGDNWRFTGVPWTFPSSVDQPCTQVWQGLYCVDPPAPTTAGLCTIYSLELGGTGLVGTLPSSIGNFSNMVFFTVLGNSLNGTIPQEIGTITALTTLYLGTNSFSGTIPSSFLQMTQLTFLLLSDNLLTGPWVLPPESLPLATDVYLGQNLLTGPLPTNLGGLKSIIDLSIFNNLFTGSIPTEIGLLTTLEDLSIYTTLLTGTIPTEIGRLTGVTDLALDVSLYTGSFPSQIVNLVKLEELLIDTNVFSDTLPSDVNLMKSLKVFSVFNNLFSGTLPAALAQMNTLVDIYVDNNLLTGPVPTDWSACVNADEIYLQQNSFSGPFPPSLLDLPAINQLEVDDNLFTGSLPVSTSGSMDISTLALSGNLWTGSIPLAYTQYTLMTQLTISGQLTGTIPDGFTHLTRLTNLQISNSYIEGSIPSDIGILLAMTELFLFSNMLTGVIPTSISQCSDLQVVSLQDNSLTGTIPEGFAGMAQLQLFELNGNSLSGPIPSDIGDLNQAIQYFDVALNQLTGSWPAALYSIPSMQMLFLYGNLLSGSIDQSLCDQQQIIQAVIYNNYLSGPLPDCLDSLHAMTQFSAAFNMLSGSIPAALGNVPTLQLLNVSSNLLDGSVYDLFNQTMDGQLQYLDLSMNSLTGSMPIALYYYSNLRAVSMYSNCMTGSLSASLCQSTTLQTVVMDGLGSGDHCQTYIPPALRPFFKSRFSKQLLQGTIPACIWNMKSLATLHLSGNGLSGPLGEPAIDGVLTDLSLENNYLTGTIPVNIQISGKYQQLSLSSNKLSGTLMSEFILSNDTVLVDLTVNRISGDIPLAFMTAPHISILSGNSFQCQQDDMPAHDPSSSSYVCGSSNLNYAYEVWAALVFFATCVSLALLYNLAPESFPGLSQTASVPEDTESPRDSSVSEAKVDKTRSSLSLLGRLSHAPSLTSAYWEKYQSLSPSNNLGVGDLTSCSQFLNVLKHSGHASLVLVLLYLIALVCFSLMKVLSSNISTHTIQYAWLSSSAYMHGAAPVVFILIFLAVSHQCCRWYFLHPLTRVVKDQADTQPSTDFRLYSHSADSAPDVPDSPTPYFWRGVSALKYFSVPVVVEVLNFVVVLSVNLLYVVAIFNGINQSKLAGIQVLMGMFKLTWNKIVIPIVMRRLKFLSPASRNKHQVFMEVFNYIAGPVLATYLTDSTCLYYAFVAEAPVTSTFTENQVLAPTCISISALQESFCFFSPTTQTLTTSFSPPWLYSYQCSSALLINYVPVLLFTFSVSGIVMPTLRGVLASASLNKLLPGVVFDHFIRDGLLDLTTEKERSAPSVSPSRVNKSHRLFNGPGLVCGTLLNFAVLMTFGLACPVLAVAVMIEAVTSAMLWKWLIEKFIARSQWNRVGAASHSSFTSTAVTDVAWWDRLEKATESSSAGLRGSMYVVVVVMSVFWSLLTFDMTADVYGNDIGGAVMVLTAVGLPVIFGVSLYCSKSTDSIASPSPVGAASTSAPSKSPMHASSHTNEESTGRNVRGGSEEVKDDGRSSQVEMRTSSVSNPVRPSFNSTFESS